MTDGTVITTTDYAGNYIYQNNVLQMINQPEGYLEPNGLGTYDYGYRLKDHLGNIRLTFVDFNHNGSIALSEITEENNYYPFGLKHKGYNFVVNSNVNAVATKFKYNGKELNDELGLDLYDYGARFYDPAIGRFHTVDPLAEKFRYETPFAYVGNNPLNFIDPDGQVKFKVQGHFKFTTGIIGVGIKALGFKYTTATAKEFEVSINLSFDTESKELTAGASALTRKRGDDELTMGGIYGGGETTEMEKGTEVKAGYDFDDNKIVASSEPIDDKEMKKVGEASITVLTGSEKEEDGPKLSVGVDPELNFGVGGVGIGVNLSVEESKPEKEIINE